MPQTSSKKAYAFRLAKPKRPILLQGDFQPATAVSGTSLARFSILPTFNNDRFFFTPAFVIPFDKQWDVEEMLERHREKEVEKVEETSNSAVFEPKPRKQKNKCWICQTKFDDYKTVRHQLSQHYRSEQHRLAIKESSYNQHILELVEGFRKSQKSSSFRRMKTRAVRQ